MPSPRFQYLLLFGSIHILCLISLAGQPPSLQSCIEKIQEIRAQGSHEKLPLYNRSCLKLYPKSHVLNHYYGLQHLEREKYLSASLHFERARELKPDKFENYLRLLRCYLATNDPLNRHRQVLKALSSRFFDKPQIHGVAGNILVEFDRFQTAFKFYREMIEKNPDQNWFYSVKIGQLYFLHQKFDLALQAFGTANLLKPNQGDVLYHIALTFEKLGNSGKAEEAMLKAKQLGISPEFLSEAD